MPVEALTDRMKVAKHLQCLANNCLLQYNAPNVRDATGDAQSQFRRWIYVIQKWCHPPENPSLWFKVFKTDINKVVYQLRLIQLPPVKVVYPENKTCRAHTKWVLDWLSLTWSPTLYAMGLGQWGFQTQKVTFSLFSIPFLKNYPGKRPQTV